MKKDNYFLNNLQKAYNNEHVISNNVAFWQV